MSGDLYTPRPDSLAARVVTFFRRLPDEELSARDIAEKWQAELKNVPVQLRLPVEAGLLSVDGSVYSAGPNIGRIEISAAAVERASTPAPSRAHVRTLIDIEAIVFEDAPAGMTAPVKSHDRWVAKLRTMPAGKSFVVGSEYRHAVRTAATTLRKEGWRISVLAEGEDKVRVVCSAVPQGVAS
jgi:hypothetical protein